MGTDTSTEVDRGTGMLQQEKKNNPVRDMQRDLFIYSFPLCILKY